MTPPADNVSTGLLARRAPAGHASIETLMALHDRDVRSALRRVLGRSQEEDDLVQEVFTRLVVRLRQPGELCVGAWLRGVAHNLAVDEIRRRRPLPVEDVRLDRHVASSAEDAVSGAELYSRVVDGARHLPDRQRAALAAALASGSSGVASVASSLGVSVHAAESLLSRARVGLRHHLADASGDGEAGSSRVSVGLVVVGIGSALAWILRRWRAAAAVSVATAALVGASFVPALSVGDAPAGGPSTPAPPHDAGLAAHGTAGDAPAPSGSDDAAGGADGQPVASAPEAPAPPAAAARPGPAGPPVDVIPLAAALPGVPAVDVGTGIVPAVADVCSLGDALVDTAAATTGLTATGADQALCPTS